MKDSVYTVESWRIGEMGRIVLTATSNRAVAIRMFEAFAHLGSKRPGTADIVVMHEWIDGEQTVAPVKEWRR